MACEVARFEVSGSVFVDCAVIHDEQGALCGARNATIVHITLPEAVLVSEAIMMLEVVFAEVCGSAFVDSVVGFSDQGSGCGAPSATTAHEGHGLLGIGLVLLGLVQPA